MDESPTLSIPVVAGAVAVAVLLLAPLGGGADSWAVHSNAASTTLQTFANPWASNNTGRVNVTFPSPFPAVSLAQDANASFTATLQVDGLFELVNSVAGHPTVVAAALPLTISRFNGTPPAGKPHQWAFGLSATLEVYPVGAGLWNSSETSPPAPAGPPEGAADLLVNYSVFSGPNGTGAVGVAWSIQSWPWKAASDLLALESHFTMNPSDHLLACTRASSLSETKASCQGAALPVGANSAPLWGGNIASLEDDNQTGPAAAVTWSTTLTAQGGPSSGGGATSVPVTAGVFATSLGAGEIVVAGSAQGASWVSGTMTLALIAPLLLGATTLLVGNPLVFGSALAIFGSTALVGILLYRRADRKARDEI